MIEIIPSILTNDPVEAREMLTRCEGVVERVSIDIIDGKFAENEAPASLRLGNLLRSLNREQNPTEAENSSHSSASSRYQFSAKADKTIDPSVFADLDTNLKLDFQLMVVEPINWIERCVRAGADRIIGHIEHMEDQLEFVGKVQETGSYVGLGVDLATPINKLDPTILTSIDVVLVMSVPAGHGGQEFSDKVIKKIKRLSEIRDRDSTPFKIQVDGGVTVDTIYNVHKIGADEVSVGRRIFEGDLAKNIEKFQRAAHGLEYKK